jgi:glutamine cyclotransferase
VSDGVLLESTGLYGHSQLRRVDPRTGHVLATVALASDRFGEGLARLGGRLFQLTWQHQTGYVYDAASLARTDSFSYTGEGWGLTTDGLFLILSDGTATLRFLDPVTFRVVRTLLVQEGTSPLTRLNELEYHRGELLANVYQSSWIVRIDPQSGRVRGWLDMADLVPPRLADHEQDVLNGIAYDSVSGDVLVTGKRWPVLYRIRLDTIAPGT